MSVKEPESCDGDGSRGLTERVPASRAEPIATQALYEAAHIAIDIGQRVVG